MSRLLVIAACALALSGCGEIDAVRKDPAEHLYQAGAILLGLDLVSLVSSGKTIDDHLIGAATDQDCSIVRASQGGPYCIPFPAPVAMVSETTYCYKSLASASCYAAPVPSDQAQYEGSHTVLVPAP
jgi:hypothetical protein